jgi:mycoredoxin
VGDLRTPRQLVYYSLRPEAVARFGALAGGLAPQAWAPQGLAPRAVTEGSHEASARRGFAPRTTDLPENGPMPDPAALPMVDRLTVYGADWCGDCRRTQRYLNGTGRPFAWVDTAADEPAKAMLKAAGYLAIPVVLFPDGTVLVEPSNDELAAALAAPA